MHEATCTHCGRSVPITPDAPRCSHCGQDLHDLIPSDYAASYFYRRSADLAARGDLPSALSEVERGLAFQEASELRLLAAILSKRLGELETMRAHIAAIPVDDRLRHEAEWLIRAQAAPRSGGKIERTRPAGETRDSVAPVPGTPAAAPQPGAPGPMRPVATRGERLTPIAQAIADSAAEPPPAAPTRPDGLWTQRIWSAVAVALMLVVGAMGWLLLSGGPDALLTFVPGLAPAEQEPVAEAPLEAVTPAATPSGVILPTPTPRGGSAAQPQPTIPADLVLLPTAAPVAAAAPQGGLQAAAFNLDAVLITVGRIDLAELDLRADLNGTTVSISGVLTNTEDRAALIELLGGVGSVQEVNAVNLLVRVPDTYTVVAGDTVWSIVSRFYGEDPYRIAALLDLNAGQLPNAEALQVGMVLDLPPTE